MRNRRDRPEVSATQLAEMGYCEQRVWFAHLHGDRTTADQRQARQRGLLLHRRYLAQGKAAASDERCFVSSHLFGPAAPETQALRAFRDAKVLPHTGGRWLVAVYYAVAPAVCWVLTRSPAATRILRRAVRHMIVLLGDIGSASRGRP